MARITQAALDAAVEQAKREAAEQAAPVIESAKREASEWRDKYERGMQAAAETLAEVEAKIEQRARQEWGSAQKSVQNAIEDNKAGKWRDNERAWYVIVAVAVGLLALLAWSLSSAHTDNECRPAYPPGLTIVCVGGYWWIDTDELPTAVRTNMKCIDRRS